MAFYSLPSGKLHKKTKVVSFYRDLGDPFGKSFDSNFQPETTKRCSK